MKIPALDEKIVMLATIIAATLIGVELLVYGGLFERQSHPVQEQLQLPGLTELNSQMLQAKSVAGANEGLMRVLPLLVLIGITVIIGVAILIMLQARRLKKVARDKQRLADLEAISAVMELYYQKHGHYPMSATYDPQYYSAINILTEWSSYNFPPAEEMRAFNPAWPMSDPTFLSTSPNQEGNYLYYPHHFGQRFSLYAQLEAPKQKPVPNYNVIDKLPPTTAVYNYRLNGIDHHTEPAAGQTGL